MSTRALAVVGGIRNIAAGTHTPYSLQHMAQQAGWAGAAEVLGLLLRYVLVLLIARLTGPLGLGLYALALAFGYGVGMAGRAGLDQALLRFIPYHRAHHELGAAVGVALFGVVVAGVLSIGAGLALFLWAPHIAVLWDQPELAAAVRLMALGLPFMVLSEVCRAGLRGFQDVRLAVVLEKVVLPLATIAALVVILRVRPEEPLAAVVGAVVAFFLVALIAGVMLAHQLRSWRTTPVFHAGAWLRFALPMSLEAGLLFIVFWTDQLMVGWFLDADRVGIYTAAVRIAMLVTVPLLAINAIFAPTIASLHGRGDRTMLQQLYGRLTWGTVFLGGGIAIALWVSGYWVLRIFGTAFVAGHFALLILVAGQVVNAGTGSSGLMLGMTGRAGWRLTNAALIATLNVGLNWLLIPPWGIAGAAVATAISIGVINLFQVMEVRWLAGFWAYDWRALAFWRSLVGKPHGEHGRVEEAVS